MQIRRYADINRYHVSTLAYFAEKLRAIPDGDGTLLDHSLILYGTNMGNSNQHMHYDVPHILVGGANGQLKGNRHLAYERKTVTTGNLLLSVLDLYGIHKDVQGDSTGSAREARVATGRHARDLIALDAFDASLASAAMRRCAGCDGSARPARATSPTPR